MPMLSLDHARAIVSRTVAPVADALT